MSYIKKLKLWLILKKAKNQKKSFDLSTFSLRTSQGPTKFLCIVLFYKLIAIEIEPFFLLLCIWFWKADFNLTLLWIWIENHFWFFTISFRLITCFSYIGRLRRLWLRFLINNLRAVVNTNFLTKSPSIQALQGLIFLCCCGRLLFLLRRLLLSRLIISFKSASGDIPFFFSLFFLFHLILFL